MTLHFYRDVPDIFEDIALKIMTIGLNKTELPPPGWEYRKGLDFEDAKKEVALGVKNGRGKLENEVGQIRSRLRTIFKEVKKK